MKKNNILWAQFTINKKYAVELVIKRSCITNQVIEALKKEEEEGKEEEKAKVGGDKEKFI